MSNKPDYLVMKLVDVEDNHYCCGNLMLEDACAFAAALNQKAVDKDEFHWTLPEAYHYPLHDYCVVEN